MSPVGGSFFLSNIGPQGLLRFGDAIIFSPNHRTAMKKPSTQKNPNDLEDTANRI
jgi:hypothetical protein